MKIFFTEVWVICGKILCSLLSRIGVSCKEHKKAAIFVSLVVYLLIVVIPVVLWKGSTSVASEKIGERFVASVTTSTKKSSTMESATSGWDCADGKNEWTLWYGDMSRSDKDKTLYFLPNDVNRGLYKYEGVVAASTTCTFKFVPRGDRAINYVVSLDEIYQIVVGDNDYWTISLRASDALGTPLKPIKELITGKERPHLLSTIKNGSQVVLEITQYMDENGLFNVTAEVSYSPSSFAPQNRKEVFSWRFPTSPALELNPLELSIGLIRGQGDESAIRVNFVSPTPQEITK